MTNFEITTNNKHDYNLSGLYTLEDLQEVISDTKTISTQRSRALLALKMCKLTGNIFFDFGSTDCVSVGGSQNGKRGGDFELAVSRYLKNKVRISPKGMDDIIKYYRNINNKKTKINLDCKQNAADLGYFSDDLQDFKMIDTNFIIYCPIYSPNLPVMRASVVIPTGLFLMFLKENNLLRTKKTNAKTLKKSIQNINSFKSVNKIMELFKTFPTLEEFVKEYNLTCEK